MSVKALTEHHLEVLSKQEVAEACPSLHLSKCRIIGNLMPWLIYQTKGSLIFYTITLHMHF